MSGENLWGDLTPYQDIKPPVAILREQAAMLSDLTNKILVGDVEVRKGGGAGRAFEIDLDIQAPALDYYFITILTVTHAIIPYPLNVKDKTNDVIYECSNEETFKQALGNILSSDSVHRIISSLLSQSKAEL